MYAAKMPDVFTKKKRSEVMSLIRSKNTKCEKILRDAMRKAGLRGYRIHPQKYGNPDFVFGKYKIAIFCDGDFWHGRNYEKLKPKLKNKFWVDKIERNMERDKKYTRELRKRKWLVLRFWETNIKRDVDLCIKNVKTALKRRRQ